MYSGRQVVAPVLLSARRVSVMWHHPKHAAKRKRQDPRLNPPFSPPPCASPSLVATASPPHSPSAAASSHLRTRLPTARDAPAQQPHWRFGWILPARPRADRLEASPFHLATGRSSKVVLRFCAAASGDEVGAPDAKPAWKLSCPPRCAAAIASPGCCCRGGDPTDGHRRACDPSSPFLSPR